MTSCQTSHFFWVPDQFSEGKVLQMRFFTSEVIFNWVIDEIYYPINFYFHKLLQYYFIPVSFRIIDEIMCNNY